MRLFIAEKPAMGRSIANNLPGPHVKKDGYIETGGGLVSWCIGHLLETAPPDAYDKKYEKFPGSFSDLPIVPQQWKLQVSGDKGKQVNTIKSLLKQCSEVVNAGDPGREGQLIIDELLDFLGNKKPVLRILLNALDDVSVKRELANLHDNRQFATLYQAGMGRQRADWLVGMNMSRAYTIIGSAAGYRGVLSVGRVQSPTLAIVVRRDLEIESFVPQDYWTLKAQFESSLPGKGGKFWATWLPPGSSGGSLDAKDDDEDDEDEQHDASGKPSWLDKSNRIIDPAVAKSIADKARGAPAQVAEAQRKRVQENAPLPFDLSAIQIMANAKWNASVQQTLQACQSLYEQGYTTYPRTDCQYLPESQHPDCGEVLSAIAQADSSLASIVSHANPSIKSRAWNDAKMGEHHAIIPTRKAPTLSSLSDLERKIYETVSKRYLAQFFPPTEADKTKIVMEVEQERFVARGRIMISPGWRSVYGGGDDLPEDSSKSDPDEDKEDDKASLPPLDQGDSASCLDVRVDAKKTKPPARFTQGTLLDAMKKVHTLVDDPQVKKKLRSVEGIGRSATRAAILETLIKRSFLESKGKQIISTQVGRSLIAALPPKLIDPALTALWETALDAVATGKASLDAFTAKQTDWLAKLIEAAKDQKITGLPQGSAPGAPSSRAAPKGKGASGKSSSASGKAASAQKAAAAPAGSKTCPKCKKGKMVKRTAKAGPNAGKEFLGCTNYPECKHAEPVGP